MYYNQGSVIYLNGVFKNVKDAKTNLYNQTMHYGNGVFEGIRSYQTEDGTRIFKAKEHYNRLRYSAEVMGMDLGVSSEELEKVTYQLLEKNNLTNAYIRPLVYLDENMSLTTNSNVNLAIMVWDWGNYLGDNMLKVMLSSFERPNPKSCFVEAKVVGHYTNNILATNEAKSKGFDEALLTDMNGFVAEGPGANFFIEKDDVLYTAPLGNILAGITRNTVFEIAAELGIEVREELFTPEKIYDADTAFFCGTAAEVIGVKHFNDHLFTKNWEETNSSLIQLKYKRKVAHNEYQNVYL